MTSSSHKTVMLHPGSKLTLLSSFMYYHLIYLSLVLPEMAKNSRGFLNFVVFLMQEKKVGPNSWSSQPSILLAEICLHLVNKI